METKAILSKTTQAELVLSHVELLFALNNLVYEVKSNRSTSIAIAIAEQALSNASRIAR